MKFLRQPFVDLPFFFRFAKTVPVRGDSIQTKTGRRQVFSFDIFESQRRSPLRMRKSGVNARQTLLHESSTCTVMQEIKANVSLSLDLWEQHVQREF